jgi:hypothetical protein
MSKEMESLEQELMIMLRDLPVPVIITWRGGKYYWQSRQGAGSSSHLITAIEEALRYLLNSLNVPEDAIKAKD